jgi:hypothetical protein
LASNPLASPGGGAVAIEAWSRIVPKMESVPSRLSITSISRLCCGASTTADVSTLHQMLPSERLNESTLFSWVCPAT